MRCPKCGYTSFDHLSQCEKCSADLTGAREALGLPALEPAIPFFLESLLKAADEEQQQGEADFQAATVEPGFELGAEEESGVAGLEPFAEPEMSVQAPSLSWTDEDSPVAEGLSDDALTVDGDAYAMSEDDIPVIEFSDDDLEPYMDVKTPPAEDLMQKSPPAGDSSTAEASEQDMVIELTDDDLEGLLLDLEDDSEEESESEARTNNQ